MLLFAPRGTQHFGACPAPHAALQKADAPDSLACPPRCARRVQLATSQLFPVSELTRTDAAHPYSDASPPYYQWWVRSEEGGATTLLVPLASEAANGWPNLLVNTPTALGTSTPITAALRLATPLMVDPSTDTQFVSLAQFYCTGIFGGLKFKDWVADAASGISFSWFRNAQTAAGISDSAAPAIRLLIAGTNAQGVVETDASGVPLTYLRLTYEMYKQPPYLNAPSPNPVPKNQWVNEAIGVTRGSPAPPEDKNGAGTGTTNPSSGTGSYAPPGGGWWRSGNSANIDLTGIVNSGYTPRWGGAGSLAWPRAQAAAPRLA